MPLNPSEMGTVCPFLSIHEVEGSLSGPTQKDRPLSISQQGRLNEYIKSVAL